MREDKAHCVCTNCKKWFNAYDGYIPDGKGRVFCLSCGENIAKKVVAIHEEMIAYKTRQALKKFALEDLRKE